MRSKHDLLARTAVKQHGVFSRAQARRCGFSEDEIDGRLRRRDWDVVYRSVYIQAATPSTFECRAMAATLAVGKDAFVSHTTAARLFDVEGIKSDEIHVTVPRGRHPDIRGIVPHEARGLCANDMTWIGPIRVATPTRLIIDLASVVHVDVLEDVRVGKRTSRSGRQNRVQRILERAGIGGIEREYDVFNEHGAFVAQVDLAIPAARLAIEFDIYTWHSSPRHLTRDRERRHRLTVAGWPPLEITEELLSRPKELVARVVARLSRPYDGKAVPQRKATPSQRKATPGERGSPSEAR